MGAREEGAHKEVAHEEDVHYVHVESEDNGEGHLCTPPTTLANPSSVSLPKVSHVLPNL